MHGTGKARLMAALVASSLGLQACHTVAPSPAEPAGPPAKGAVSYTLVPSGDAGRYQLKRNEHAFGAEPVTHDPPAYPPALVARALPPTTVKVKAIVDESGAVTEVRDLDPATSADHALFLAACRQAVMQWRYTPMMLIDEYDDGKGNISQTKKPAPFSLDYAFQFELVNGQPKVSATQ